MPAAPSLDDVTLLVDAVRAGGVRALARQRGVPRSTVSRGIARLEASLGLTLITRNTARLQLTEAGEGCFDRLAAAVDEARDAVTELSSTGREVRGLLRLTTTPIFADLLLPDLVAAFLERHPKARVEVVPSPDKLDLEAQRVDVAVRAGALPDSDRLAARRLGSVTLGFFASPGYLARRGPVRTLEELLAQDLLVTQRQNAVWLVQTDHGRESLRVTGRVHAENNEFLRHLCERGAGIARLPTYQVSEQVSAGALVPVLESAWLTADLNLLYLLKGPARAKAFVAVCADVLKDVKLADVLRAAALDSGQATRKRR